MPAAHSTRRCFSAQDDGGDKASPKDRGLPSPGPCHRAVNRAAGGWSGETSQKCQEAFGKAKAMKTPGDLQASTPGGIRAPSPVRDATTMRRLQGPDFYRCLNKYRQWIYKNTAYIYLFCRGSGM